MLQSSDKLDKKDILTLVSDMLLAGIDTCASNYWWMPELEGSAPQSPAVRDDSRLAAALQRRRRVADQATIRPASRPTAAA